MSTLPAIERARYIEKINLIGLLTFSFSHRALTHQTDLKIVARTKSGCCVTSRCLCLVQKVALEHTLAKLQPMANKHVCSVST